MSAFCIFGISKSICKTVAEKKTSTFDKLLNRSLTMEEWTVRRDALSADLFANSTRRVKCSPELDAPQFLADWLAINPLHIRLPVVMVRGPKIDKAGAEVKRGGVVVMTWVEYMAPRMMR